MRLGKNFKKKKKDKGQEGLKRRARGMEGGREGRVFGF